MMVDADINTAQVFLQCGLCNQPFHRFCNTCQLGLCEHCIGTHVRSLPLRHHDIVPYTEIVEYNKFFRGVYTTPTRHVRPTATIVMFPSAYDVSRVLNTKPTLL